MFDCCANLQALQSYATWGQSDHEDQCQCQDKVGIGYEMRVSVLNQDYKIFRSFRDILPGSMVAEDERLNRIMKSNTQITNYFEYKTT